MDDIEKKCEAFQKSIDDWISGHFIDYGLKNSSELVGRVYQIMYMSEEDLRKMSSVDCQTAIYSLNKYMTYINNVIAREKAVKQWAEQGIWYIITGQKHEKYAKWEEKYYSAIRNSEIGLKLQKLKTTSESRILSAESQVKGIEQSIKVLENISRSKSYERS